MNWYRNLRTRAKLLLTMVTVMILLLVVYLVCVLPFSRINEIYKTDLTEITNKISYVWDADYYVADISNKLQSMMLNNGNDDIVNEMNSVLLDDIRECGIAIENYNNVLKNLIYISDEEKNDTESLAKKLEQLVLDEYIVLVKDTLALIDKGDIEGAKKLYNESVVPVADDISECTNDIYYESLGYSESTITLNNNEFIRSIIVSGLVMFGAIIIGVILSIVNSRLIAGPIKNLAAIASRMADGDLNITLSSNTRDEVGILTNDMARVIDSVNTLTTELEQVIENDNKGNYTQAKVNVNLFHGDYQHVAEGINKMLANLYGNLNDVEKCVTAYADGDFNATMTVLPGEKYALTEAVNNLSNNLKNVSVDIGVLVRAATDGELSTNANASVYKGNWRELVNQLNSLMSAIARPINALTNSLSRFSKGDLKCMITDDFKGEYNLIKHSLNETVESISSYINEMSACLDQMAHKDLNVNISRDYVGDFSVMKESINNIAHQFNVVLDEIRSAADQINEGARNISDSSLALAEGASEQAQSVDQILINIDTIAQGSAHMADIANKANALSEASMKAAETGNDEMKDMLNSMEEINKSSKDIAEIIKVIEEIAFQTNLLALNAAVEAARAGQSGKGFTVVADAVRDLASRSKVAAQDTTELIERSLQKAEEGSIIANHTAEALQDIVKQVHEVSELVGEITTDAAQQSISIKDVNHGMSQIATVTQQNTASSEMSASSAEELSSQAETFNDMVSMFKLKNM